MKKDKRSSGPAAIPQMALFESELQSPAPTVEADESAATQPEAAVQNQPPPPVPARKTLSKPPRSSKPLPKPIPVPEPVVVPTKSDLSPPQTAPRKGKASGSSAVPEGDVRLTANIRQDLHLKLKIAAARQRTTIGELIEQWVENTL